MMKMTPRERPRDIRKALKLLRRHMRRHAGPLALIALLVVVSASANVYGTYLLKPAVNDYILPGDFAGLARSLVILALIYIAGAAASYGQTRLMVGVAQRTVNVLRRDLFAKLQTLPLRYSDRHTHGELMSRFTNDVDTSSSCRARSRWLARSS